jgi:hypothetical protein
MDSMMKGMLKALPAQEREALMLKMMPDMLAQVDMAKVMPTMLKELAGLVTLASLFDFLQLLFNDDDFKRMFKDKHGDAMEKMSSMMEMMHPMMMTVMPEIMPKMMKFMSTMMPNMHEIMPQVMDEAMIPMLKKDPDMKTHMLGMMQAMFPHCATNLFPLVEKDTRIALVTKLFAIMTRSASMEMDTDEKSRFHQEASKTVEHVLHTTA